ncbi:dTDP-4-dehydrorhamnose 3,5-epimerase family protein [Streptomyces cyaneofuscatus]|uniref:dTDP-4-dehydrorhamnose 3,5-epimerase family protein n=1 Tax=Streptomyces cyaneofuscatus TaxID=66883 RepID=UPI00367484A1
MQITELEIAGVFVLTPDRIVDSRGSFHEALRTDEFERETGHVFSPRQINYSVSNRNTLRGIHGVTTPPGQAKFVTCVRGVLRDFVVDLRVGSPTFGQSVSNQLDTHSSRSVYIPEGVGHGFLTLTDDACISYVLSTVYVPGTQIDINPMDPDLAIPWGFAEYPLISAKDAQAPSLKDTLSAGKLMDWRESGREAV